MRLRPAYVAMRAYHRGRMVRAGLARPRPWGGVRIFGYHSISARRDPLCVPPDAFRAQMEAVAAADATPVRLEDALDLLARPVQGRYVCVTFDDGYRDNAEAAEPVLQEHGIPATIFVASGIAAGRETFRWFDDPPPALGWDELRDLAARGLLDVQAHSITHPWLPRVGEEQARQEIAGCKAEIEEQLGRELTSFCYPAGLYGDRDVRLVTEAGFRAGVTTDPGVNGGGDDPFRLRRTLVFRQDGPRGFAAKLAGHFDRPPPLRRWLYARRAGE